MVVVQSGSMQHGETGDLGVIDTGDLVLVKNVKERSDIITWVVGKRTDHRTYGDYGDVIIYRKFGRGDLVPIIHRAVVYLEVNATTGNTFDIPSMGIYDYTGIIKIENYGYNHLTLQIDTRDLELREGFITLGDNNNGRYDQMSGTSGSMLVRTDWIVGKARGEIPWFGLIKLVLGGDLSWNDYRAPSNNWRDLKISLVLLIGVPLGLDLFLEYFYKPRKKEAAEVEKEKKMEENGKKHRGKRK